MKSHARGNPGPDKPKGRKSLSGSRPLLSVFSKIRFRLPDHNVRHREIRWYVRAQPEFPSFPLSHCCASFPLPFTRFVSDSLEGHRLLSFGKNFPLHQLSGVRIGLSAGAIILWAVGALFKAGILSISAFQLAFPGAALVSPSRPGLRIITGQRLYPQRVADR